MLLVITPWPATNPHVGYRLFMGSVGESKGMSKI